MRSPGLATAFAAALIVPMAAVPSRAADADDLARLARLWEGGTWNSDIAANEGWLSGFKTRRQYAHPTYTPPNPIPLDPAAAARAMATRRALAHGKIPDDPRAACHPPGMPYLLARDPNGGFRAVVSDRELDFLYGSQDSRRIHLDAPYPPQADAAMRAAQAERDSPFSTLTYNGYSVGAFEGEVFVVRTNRIKGEHTEIEPHVAKAEGSEIVERYTPAGPDGMDAEVTMTNPEFTRPWVFTFHLRRDPYGAPVEALCTDKDQYKVSR